MKIDKEIIKEHTRNLPSKMKSMIITLHGLPHSGKYLALSLLFFLFFLTVTFPYDYLIKKKIYSLEGRSFRTIDIPKLDFSIFGETYINDFMMVMNNNNEITCKNSIFNISLTQILLNNRFKSDFQFDSLKYISKDFELILNVNGNIDLVINKKNGLPENGFIKIILSDATVKLNNLSIPGPLGPLPLKIDVVNIQSGNIDTSVSNHILKFNNFKIAGNDILGDITGNIELSEISNNSKLDLVININSESGVLEQYQDLLSSFIRNNILSLTVKGIAGKPELKIVNTGKNEN